MIQQAIVDLVVAGAAAWLMWSFAPGGVRRRLAAIVRPRRATAAGAEKSADCACGSDDGCH